MLKLIKGNLEEKQKKMKEKREKKREIYKKLTKNRDNFKTLVLFTVKYYGKFGMDELDELKASSFSCEEYYKKLREILEEMLFTEYLMSCFTIETFENLFPITKEYKGDKFYSKDYFYTQKKIEEMGLRNGYKLIGTKIDELLFEYWNDDILLYNVFKMCLIYRLELTEGRKPTFDSFLEENNISTMRKISDDVFYDSKTKRTYKAKKNNRNKKNFRIIK